MEIDIRIASPEDAAELLAIYAPYVQKTAITFEYDVPSEEEFRGRIVRILAKYPYIKAMANGEIIVVPVITKLEGYIKYFLFDKHFGTLW